MFPPKTDTAFATIRAATDRIGADKYAQNAMETVHYAQQVFGM